MHHPAVVVSGIFTGARVVAARRTVVQRNSSAAVRLRGDQLDLQVGVRLAHGGRAHATKEFAAILCQCAALGVLVEHSPCGGRVLVVGIVLNSNALQCAKQYTGFLAGC